MGSSRLCTQHQDCLRVVDVWRPWLQSLQRIVSMNQEHDKLCWANEAERFPSFTAKLSSFHLFLMWTLKTVLVLLWVYTLVSYQLWKLCMWTQNMTDSSFLKSCSDTMAHYWWLSCSIFMFWIKQCDRLLLWFTIHTIVICYHFLPSVLRAAPASMGMTRRGKIPLRPTTTEPTRDKSQTWACSLAKKSATAWTPGRSVRTGPGPAAVAVAWPIAVCVIFWLPDANLVVSISRVTVTKLAAQLGFLQLPPFIRPTVQNALVTSNAVRGAQCQTSMPLQHLCMFEFKYTFN